jgi:hypothetical protein
MDDTARGVGAVEEAMHAAEKHEARSEKLAALVAEARGIVEQARAAEAERARTATEAAAEVAAVVAAKRERLAALALEVQQLQAELGSGTPQPDAEETMCVVCMDAPKNRVVLPCMHMCACEACAQLLRDRCPVCRGPIERITQLFYLNQRHRIFFMRPESIVAGRHPRRPAELSPFRRNIAS